MGSNVSKVEIFKKKINELGNEYKNFSGDASE